MSETSTQPLFQARLSSRRIIPIQTPTGSVSVIRPIAEQLLAQGVICGKLDEVVHASDAAVVKAALMSIAGTCDFCAAPGATHVYDTPDEKSASGESGWAACDACHEHIIADQRQALLKRSVESGSFGKFAAGAIAELHARFWRGREDLADAAGVAAALANYVEGFWPDDRPVVETSRDRRIARALELTGITRAQLDTLTSGTPDMPAVRQVLKAWGRHTRKGQRAGEFATDVAFQVSRVLGDAERKPLTPVLPHWQLALDRKFEALRFARQLATTRVPAHHNIADRLDPANRAHMEALRDDIGLARDVYRDFNVATAEALRHAESYSFNAETAGAILSAAESLPPDAPLSSVDTPGNGRAGWFWFSEPLPICADDEIATTAALLWFWANDVAGKPELRIVAYAIDRTDAIKNTCFWTWRRPTTVAEMCDDIADAHRKQVIVTATDTPIGQDVFVAAAGRLARFLMAACLWMKETVVVASAGHVERHARKRHAREHKLDAPPTVQVIALRRSAREQAERTATPRADGVGREYEFRFVVRGHPRLQACGPERKDRKLIWISPFVKGPDDKPLRTRERVYSVVR